MQELTTKPGASVRPRNPLKAWFDVRKRSVSSWAFALNRLTGLGLTLYLFLHLIVLSTLLRGEAGSHTPYETLQTLPTLFKEAVEKQADVTFDRSNLADLGDYTINFEIIYHIESADFDLFVKRKEAIYLEIIRQLQEKNVSMPYPTQPVLVQK